MIEKLKTAVLAANLDLARSGLVGLTWGNVSGIDRTAGLVVIKPSGVPYEALTLESMVVLDMAGRVVEGALKPSSDAPTHLAVYRAFPMAGGVAHTHSAQATAFAQALREIPCLGTTHADHFRGPVPVTRPLTQGETAADYEANTGRVIVERFTRLDPAVMPAVLVAHHGPFTWGRDAGEAVRNSVALETVAQMAHASLALRPDAPAIPSHLLDRHFRRKHGPEATYGQS